MSEQNNKILGVIAEDMRRLSGNVFTEKQFLMMDSRIKRRLAELGMQDLNQYFDHYTRNKESESQELLSLLTTHYTFFFREFEAFIRLQEILPKLVESAKKQGRSKLKIWSSACSYGHEVYTMAMFLEKNLVNGPLKFDYQITASDIDPQAVKRAQNGVFRKSDLNKVPLEYSQGLWDKGRGDKADFVRIKKSILDKCEFTTHNLLESAQNLGKFDAVLARNVLIYFNEQNVAIASKNLLDSLEDPGVAICGVSEYLNIPDKGVTKIVGPLYLKDSTAAQSAVERPAAAEKPQTVVAKDKVLKVVCVDDSRSVLSLLGKMLTKDRGFEIVATAGDGVEAQSVIKRVKPDLVT
ncbi:MAG: CheR family methyltransferase, partial [Pseudomonadota bacterium]